MLWSLGPEALPWQAVVTSAAGAAFFAAGMLGLLAMLADESGRGLTRAVVLSSIAAAFTFPVFLVTYWRSRRR